jgi:hypothetical protein
MDAAPPDPAGPPSAPRSSTARALIAVAVLVAVVAVGAVAAVVIVVSTDDASDVTGWNTIVAVDRLTGEVTLLDAVGVQLDRFETGIDEPRVHLVGPSHLVLEGRQADRRAIAIVDVRTGAVTDFDLDEDIAPGDQRNLSVRPIPDAPAFLVVDDGQPGPAYLVTLDGDIVDIALEARWDDPLINSLAVRASPDGSVVAIADFSTREIETAIVRPADLDVLVVDGSLVSLSNERVRTITGRSAERFDIATFDLSGERTETFSVDPFRGAIDTDDGDLITATFDGEIRRWSPNGGSETLAEYETGGGDELDPTIRTDGPDPTLAVGAADGTVLLVGSDGAVIDDVRLAARIFRFDVGRGCIPAITDTTVAVIEAATGEILAEQDIGQGSRTFIGTTDDDACTVLAFGSDDASLGVLIGADVLVEFDQRESLAGLSGDGSTYATRNSEGEISVRRVDDPREAVDLEAGDFASIYFVRR